jgi:hypothetical protein
MVAMNDSGWYYASVGVATLQKKLPPDSKSAYYTELSSHIFRSTNRAYKAKLLLFKFLTSALVGGEWSDSRPCRFTPGKEPPGAHFMEDWVDPRACLDDMEKWKFLPYRDSNSRPPVVQPVASRYTDWAIPAPTGLI